MQKTNGAVEGAINALTFNQGDLDSLIDAKNFFTPDGWRKFVENKKDWLDEKGAPTYNSIFLPVRMPPEISTENDVIKIKIIGDLIQSQEFSKTTYRASIDINIDETGKIFSLVERIDL